MAGCCVPGCGNSTAKGYSLRSFPRDLKRREQWIANIGVPNWQPNVNSRICEAHFAKTAWEKVRCDGKRKLKCNAVPTIFFHRTIEAYDLRDPSKSNKDNSTVNMFIARLTNEGEVKIDYQYQLRSNDIERLKNQKPSDGRPNPFIIEKINEKTKEKTNEKKNEKKNEEETTDWKERCEELTRRLTKSEKECQRLRGIMKKREDLFNKLIRRSYNCGKVLKERLRKLRIENQLNSKLNIRLREVFNEDQIRAIINPIENRKWSDETIKRAARLRLTCGLLGYQEILEQHFPLPLLEIVEQKMGSVELDN